MTKKYTVQTALAIMAVFAVLGTSALAADSLETVDTSHLTLEQALSLADTRNRDVQKAREFYNEVDGRYVEERAAALPQLSLIGQGTVSQDKSQAAFGGNSASDQKFYSTRMEISQQLFTWGKIGAAIRAAEKGRLTADERLRAARQDTRRDVAVEFYNILLAQELHSFALSNKEQKTRHLEEAQRKFAAGVATDYDVLAAKVSTDNAKPEVIRSENNLKVTRERLRFILAAQGEVGVQGSLEPPEYVTPAFAAAIKEALERRPELKEIRHRRDIASELVKVANADDKPRVEVTGAYGYRRLDAGGTTSDGQAWNAGIAITFPFFDGMRTRGKVAQAVSQRTTLEIEESKLAEMVALEVREAINRVEESREIVTSLSGTVTQAERLLAMAEKGYNLGVKIRLEVEDAELNLIQARSNLARAKRDFLVAKTGLERVQGILGE